MRTSWLVWASSALLTTALAAACGGSVMVDPGAGASSGTGGSGAAAGTGGTTTTSGGGGSSTTTTGGGTGGSGGNGLVGLCIQVCDLLAECYPVSPDCVDECVHTTHEDCQLLYEHYLHCLLAEVNPPQCDQPLDCFDEMEAFEDCMHNPPPPCGPVGCWADSSGACGCELSCPNVTYGTECHPAGGGMASCLCQVNGQVVGGCTDQSNNPCDPYLGCCAGFFFMDEG